MIRVIPLPFFTGLVLAGSDTIETSNLTKCTTMRCSIDTSP
jgi:hypothetical protein